VDSTTHHYVSILNAASKVYDPEVPTVGTGGDCVKFASNGLDLLDYGAACGGSIPAQYETWSVQDGPASNTALSASTPPTMPTGKNLTGVTETITKIYCTVDAGSGTTFTLTDNSSNNLLSSSPGACSTAGTSVTVSGTHNTLASLAFMQLTVTPDGTAKAVTVSIGGTY
jgi:hypothetical protein